MMHDPTQHIHALFQTFSEQTITHIDKLPQSGSDRRYFRVHVTPADASGKNTFIVAYSQHTEENNNFIRYAAFFKSHGIRVPEVLAVSDNQQWYVQEDLGYTSLLDVVLKQGFTENVYKLYEQALSQLASMQVAGKALTDSNAPVFDQQAILHDLLYFKFYFADVHPISYDKSALFQELQKLASETAALLPKYFMFRDFQSRNIMVHQNEVYCIDFQGAMQGHPAYDAASLLYQAKASLPDDWKEKLFKHYLLCFQQHAPVHTTTFTQAYRSMVFIRMLQTLGAYGFRGLIEKKAHFISSIAPALNQLREALPAYQLQHYPELKKVLQALTGEDVLKKYKVVQAKEDTPLVVHINSFSFIKRGYPAAESDNGGGYVFDCRGILNPGRLEEFKTQTGRDPGVIDFLESQTRMKDFLQHVYNVVDITVENYIERGFDHLTVNFGCTGGQHRSVYAADALSKHLRDKYNVPTIVHHLEQTFNA
ncbi:MAG TPA: RNase adapter RapZ [Ferruginibacter sp.]|nr:RNase adapter RapZ [Ferruginibacter sp.]